MDSIVVNAEIRNSYEVFKEFLQDNMIMIEPEPQIPGISKYRRK